MAQPTRAEGNTAAAKKASGARSAKNKPAAVAAKGEKSAKNTKKAVAKAEKGEKLVIVESPAKAKTIGKFLGRGYRVVASNGHIRDLPKSQLGVDVEHGFTPKYITLRGRGDVLERIRKEAKNADKIFLATDPDREGEAISWHLAQILKLDETAPCRIVFNEITPTAIKGAIKHPRSIDMDLVDAQQARRLLDRLVGYKLSPLLWAKVRKGLSAGRVQSVATRIICDREEEIRAFVPEEYWVVAAKLYDSHSKKTFEAKLVTRNGKKYEVKTGEEAQAVADALETAAYRAVDVKTAEKIKHAPAPFTTSNLQQEAARKLGFTTKRTMLIAQQLYEGVEIRGQGAVGLVTYIRTDSVRVSTEAQAQTAQLIQERYGEQYVPERPNIYKGRKNAQDAHEAIRPTYPERTPESVKDSLTPEQFKLYRLIYNRFFASQMKSAVYETMTVSIDAAGERQKDVYGFRATGSRVLFDGFTAVYTEGRDDEQDEKETKLPPIEVGDAFKCRELKKDQHFTQPPQRYTEASLVKELEELGIGRPSTYAPTITTIVDRGYVRREKRTLFPTELGEIVTRLMKENFPDIVDVKFTADMEEKLDSVEEGKRTSPEVLSEFYGPFEKTLEKAEASIEKVKIEDEVSDIPCEKCGAMMVYKMGRYGRFLACPNFPACRNTKAIVETIDAPCPKCGAKVIKRKSKAGKVFYGCERYPDCDFISWDMPAVEKCEKCGGPMVYKQGRGGMELRCTNKECGHVMRKPRKAESDE